MELKALFPLIRPDLQSCDVMTVGDLLKPASFFLRLQQK